jgi:hypothetical protein
LLERPEQAAAVEMEPIETPRNQGFRGYHPDDLDH